MFGQKIIRTVRTDMNMKPLQFPVLITLFLLLSLPTVGSNVHAKELITDSETATVGSAPPVFCQKLQISHMGAVCESPYGSVARLDFPLVDLESVIAGKQFLPSREATFSARDQVIGNRQYRNLRFVLRWESTTPDFLQVYMADIAPSWEDQGVPYRLRWRASYETCGTEACEHWTKVEDRGEYLPSDISSLPKDLAADSNFNGVPASFWNTNLAEK
jgi:hypothetical protein